MTGPAHYIVFHPEDKRLRTTVKATALVGRECVRSWTGVVWLDKPPGNEDPFVLGSSWAYSYCHATELRREPDRNRNFVTKGSCILFCSGDFANRDMLAVDTVFWIAEAHRWCSADLPPSRYAQDVNDRSDFWKFHLRFGGLPKGHKGKYTYEGALYQASTKQYSRLPLCEKGERVEVALKELPASLRERIANKVYGKHPVLISDSDLTAILRLLDDRTATAVIRDITVTDPGFLALRRESDTGCQPCSRTKC